MDNATLYHKAHIAKFGITLADFEKDVAGTLRHCGQESAPEALANDFLPLLPAQAKLAKELRDQEELQLKRTVVGRPSTHRSFFGKRLIGSFLSSHRLAH